MKTKESVMGEVGIRETAEILNVSISTLYKLVQRGLLTKHKRAFGRQRAYFIRTEVEQLRDNPEVVPVEQ